MVKLVDFGTASDAEGNKYVQVKLARTMFSKESLSDIVNAINVMYSDMESFRGCFLDENNTKQCILTFKLYKEPTKRGRKPKKEEK